MTADLPTNLRYNLGLGATSDAVLTGDLDEVVPVLPKTLSPVEKVTQDVVKALMRGEVKDRSDADCLVYQS